MFVMLSGIRAAVFCAISPLVIKGWNQNNVTFSLSSLGICFALRAKPSAFFGETSFFYFPLLLVTKKSLPAGKLILSLGVNAVFLKNRCVSMVE